MKAVVLVLNLASVALSFAALALAVGNLRRIREIRQERRRMNAAAIVTMLDQEVAIARERDKEEARRN